MAAYIPATPEQEAAAEAEFQDIRATAQWYICNFNTREIRAVLIPVLADYPKLLRQVGSLSWRELPEIAVRALRNERQRIIEESEMIEAARAEREGSR
jgi:hypothetical protein